MQSNDRRRDSKAAGAELPKWLASSASRLTSTLEDEITLEHFEVLGLFNPATDLCVLRHNLTEKQIDIAKTLLHEQIHRIQHLISPVGLMVRTAWLVIYDALLDILALPTAVRLPLKYSFLSLVKLAQPNGWRMTCSAFDFLSRWVDLGTAQLDDRIPNVTLSSVLSSNVSLELHGLDPVFHVTDHNKQEQFRIPITVTMVLESMAYYHALNSRFVFLLGENDYLTPIADRLSDQSPSNTAIDKFSPLRTLETYFINPMPPAYRLPHCFILSKLYTSAFDDNVLVASFGIINTLAAVTALLCSNYIESGPYIPEVYANALSYLTQHLQDFTPAKIHQTVVEPESLRRVVDSTIAHVAGPGSNLRTAVTRMTELVAENYPDGHALGDNWRQKSKVVTDALISDPLYLLDPHNLTNLFVLETQPYIFGDKMFRKNLDQIDRHMLLMTMLFDLLWQIREWL